jgi:hypothetical protein
MQESAQKPKFNNDLLLHPEDLPTARMLYPELADTLYHPQLVAYFKEFDDQANNAKHKSRRLGTWAILLGGTAIAMAAIDVAIRVLAPGEVDALLTVGLGAAACGLCSAALGAFGTLFGRRKYEWLINRFMSERIRQFHFQTLIAQLPEILAMAAVKDKQASAKVSSIAEGQGEKEQKVEPAEVASFRRNRERRLVAFQTAFDVLPREAKFGVTVRPDGETDWELCEEAAKPLSLQNQPALQEFFEAYRELRLQHQLDFANFKLTSDPNIFSDKPLRQSEL